MTLWILYHEAKTFACASSQITLVPFLLCKNVTCCIAPPFPKSLRLFGFPLFLRSRQYHSSRFSAIGQRPKACTASLSVNIIPQPRAQYNLFSPFKKYLIIRFCYVKFFTGVEKARKILYNEYSGISVGSNGKVETAKSHLIRRKKNGC